jgi:hypothetical protein
MATLLADAHFAVADGLFGAKVVTPLSQKILRIDHRCR